VILVSNMMILAAADHHTNEYGTFRMYVVSCSSDSKEHVVLVKGRIENQENVFCRIQSYCLPGFTFDSSDCDCKPQLDYSMRVICDEGAGIILYLNQEGRGHGLVNKVKALNNKNAGMDTFEAVTALGLSEDIRSYDAAVEILTYFAPSSINLLTNNPVKIRSITDSNISVKSITNIPVILTDRISKHLRAKQARGHFINLDSGADKC
jgi:GTP cyclohydrolase II